jgi:hypothetical protein
MASFRSLEDVIGNALLFGICEALRLQIEHRPIAAAERHQLVVRAKLDHPAVFQHADPVGVANRLKAMRDQNGCAMPSGREQALENLGFSSHIELRGRFVQQHDASAQSYRGQCASERNALPLAAG